jgi:spermidine synthase
MKPRITLAQTTLPDGNVLELHEHDDRKYLYVHGQQLAGPGSRIPDEELANLGIQPFRSARQPKILVMGLGLGGLLNAVSKTVLQKRASISIYEPNDDLVLWQREFFEDSPFANDPRISMIHDFSPSLLAREDNTFHAILLNADTAPIEKGKMIFEDKRWLGAANDALQPGGLIGITAMKKIPGIYQLLKRMGYDVVEHFVEGNTNAKRPRRYPIWLGRKGTSEE